MTPVAATSIFQGMARAGGVRTVVGVQSRATAGTMTEAGIGAVIPWAGKLWFLNYPDTSGQGTGLGLWSMDSALSPVLVGETNECDVARVVYGGKLYIGRYVVDYQGNTTPITGFSAGERITAYAKLPLSTDLWALTMAGAIYKVNTTTYVATLVNSVVAASGALNISGLVHGKAMWGHPTGRYLFCVFNGSEGNGRLAAFDTTLTNAAGAWATLDAGNASWINVGGCYEFNQHVFAFGHDDLSALMWVFPGTSYSTTPVKYRIPMSADHYKHTYQQEWMRLRAVETERFVLDLHGGFYQLSTVLAGSDDATSSYPRLEPLARHARTIPDFCFWNGHLVVAGNQASPQSGNLYPDAGQPQSGLLLTTLDDVWSWGKPAGTGYWYRSASVSAGTVSQPMLMRGYKDKEVHLVNATGSDVAVDVLVRMTDLSADYTYTMVTVPANGHAGVILPGGDWVKVKPQTTCTNLTAWVVYS